MRSDIHSKLGRYGLLNGFTQAGLLVRCDFGDGKARYERAQAERHDHLVDVHNGRVIELSDCRLVPLLQVAAGRLSYCLVDYRMGMFGESKKAKAADRAA